MDNVHNKGDFIFYNSNNGNTNIQVIIGDETVWATQKTMSEIFSVEVPAISKHVGNIIESGELNENTTVSKMETVQLEGARKVKRNVDFYNLDMIIAIGYRVNSHEATQFRIWATKVLKEYLIKGFALDDDRLKQGKTLFGIDYFNELVERIREIRASERRFYQKITDIYAQCSIDYDKDSPTTQMFFATVQNKLHYAITHHTAAELISGRANSRIPHMGLTSWKAESDGGKILKLDVSVAKNYLKEDEIKNMNRIVNMYLDYAEDRAERQIKMKMKDWVNRLDAFLKFNEYDICKNAGKISKKVAIEKAEKEYTKYRAIQDHEFESDFDKVVKDIKTSNTVPSKYSISIKEVLKGPKLSDLNKKLKKGLEYNPKAD